MIQRLQGIHEVHRFKVEQNKNVIVVTKGNCKINIAMYKGKNTKVIITLSKDPLVGDMFSFQVAVKSLIRIVNKGSIALIPVNRKELIGQNYDIDLLQSF